MKRNYEGLANYLQQSGAPGDVRAVGLQPRQPVGPSDTIPGGFRPIPTSSQGPKRTNATIVYSRTAVADSQTLGRVGKSIRDGDVVFTERFAPMVKNPIGQNVKVTSMQLLNQYIEKAGPMNGKDFQTFFFHKDDKEFKWNPDGVVNNLDGEDPYNEFKDFAIANVAIQGFCRFSTLALPQKSARNGDKVFLALVKRPLPNKDDGVEVAKYRFELFLASQVTTGKFDVNILTDYAWRIGRVVDGNQSKNMITVCVGVDSIHDPAYQVPYEWLSGSDFKEFEKAVAQ